MQKIVIVGGGASGLVAAIYAKNDNNEVIILEKNESCGKKILATGNGKCNYYNDNQDISNYYSNSDSLKEIINPKNISKVLEFFKELGLVSKIKSGYYYPLSEQASSIRNILLNKVKEKNVAVKCNFNVKSIEKLDSKFIIKSDIDTISCDKVVIASASYASLNNKGEVTSYNILNKFNLKIEKVLPSLVQLIGKGNYFKEWNGVRTDVSLKLFENNKLLKEENGQIQLTDYGISGICTFNLSGYVSRGLSLGKKEEVMIDFLPSIGDLVSFFEDRNRTLDNPSMEVFFEGLINNKLVSVILNNSNISKNKRFNELDDTEKEILIKNIKSFKLEIINTKDFSKAQTCTGGLSLDEVNPKTLEVNKVRGLYVIGELLDVDGLCGGYNLTFSWLSGILAGSDLNA